MSHTIHKLPLCPPRLSPITVGEDVRHPPPTETELYFALAGHIALWVVSVTVTFFAAIGLFRYIRRRLGYQNETSLSHVHGAARAASEQDAQRAARGDSKPTPMHGQTFPD